jgi:hypothetical protein
MLTEEEYKLGSNSYVKLVIALPFSYRHTVLKQSAVVFPRNETALYNRITTTC